jgi:hypothetical protein
MVLLAGGLLEPLRGDEQHQPSPTECHVGPVAAGKVEYRKPRCRQVVGERLAGGDWADVAFRRGRLVLFVTPKRLKQTSGE